jgi:argininosuccinate synthase
MSRQRIVLAFSGGLDTSFCVAYLREKYKAEIITVTVDTGGFSKNDLTDIRKRAESLGAVKHYTIDGKGRVYNEFVTYLIKGNVLRGSVYPLSVGAERVVQAEEIVKIARREKAAAIAHGSTGAGNDQVRFDVAFGVLAPDLKVLAPIRDLGLTREEETKYLTDRGYTVKSLTRKYSVNAGLWGTTIGGGETHDSWLYPPEEAFTMTAPVEKTPKKPENVELWFEGGVPVALGGKKLTGIEIIKQLNAAGARHGVGRGIHIGDTILGIKGRIAFESPAPLVLVNAHRELEKLVLTRWQLFWKDHISGFFGMLLHEAQYYDPVVEDIKALIDSSQKNVTGAVKVRLFRGAATVTGCKSPHSFMAKQRSAYGETTNLWTSDDARGFCKIYGIQSRLARSGKSDRTGAKPK